MASPIDVVCQSCDAKLKAGSHLAGKTVPCPRCKEPVSVPADAPVLEATQSETADAAATPKRRKERPATEKQKAFATDLGIEFEDDISARVISAMIDAALEREEAVKFGDIESHLKTLRNSEPGEMLDELANRGIQSMLFHWDQLQEPGAFRFEMTSSEGVSTELARYIVIQYFYQQAEREGVDFSNLETFFAYLRESAKFPK